MSKDKKGNSKTRLPSVESMIIWVAIISFGLWAFSKCSKDDFKDIRDKAIDIPELNTTDDTTVISSTTSPADTISANLPVTPPTGVPAIAPSTPAAAPQKTATPTLSRLYVTIDNLKIRSKPALNGEIIERLPLYATVYFMEEVTDSTQQINLGRAVADEPWIKVKSTKGNVGWVYGAGVHYYKIKNEDAY